MNIKNEELMKLILSKKVLNQTIAFTGHRPNKLYGYNLKDRRYQKLAWKIYHLCKKQMLENNIIYYISGCALGLDTVAFFAIEQLKRDFPDKNIKNILAIPYKTQSSNWISNEDKDRYKRMLKACDGFIEVDSIPEYNEWGYEVGVYNVNKLLSRDKFMADYCSKIIGVTTGLPSGTEKCLNYAKNNNVEIIKINPKNIE